MLVIKAYKKNSDNTADTSRQISQLDIMDKYRYNIPILNTGYQMLYRNCQDKGFLPNEVYLKHDVI